MREVNRWIAVAKLVLRIEFPESKFDYFDEWPTVECSPQLFDPRRTVMMRADIGIVPKGASRDLERLAAVVEVGALSNEKKLGAWSDVLPPSVRVIWLPKLDLLAAVQPGLNRFRFNPPPITRDDVFNELARQLGEIAKMRQESEVLRRTVRHAVSEQLHAMGRAATVIKSISQSMDHIAIALHPEGWEALLTRIASDVGADATSNTLGLAVGDRAVDSGCHLESDEVRTGTSPDFG